MRDETEKGKKGRRGRKWGEKEKERERRESWQKGGKNGGRRKLKTGYTYTGAFGICERNKDGSYTTLRIFSGGKNSG